MAALCLCKALLFRIVLVILVPLFKDFLPVDNFTVGYCLGLVEALLVLPFLGVAQFHCLNGGIVKDVYPATAYALVKVGRSESLALYVEIGYVELEHRAQCVAHHLLCSAVTGHLLSQKFAYDMNLAFRKFTSSHIVTLIVLQK